MLKADPTRICVSRFGGSKHDDDGYVAGDGYMDGLFLCDINNP